jgi:hypothetical protein
VRVKQIANDTKRAKYEKKAQIAKIFGPHVNEDKKRKDEKAGILRRR